MNGIFAAVIVLFTSELNWDVYSMQSCRSQNVAWLHFEITCSLSPSVNSDFLVYSSQATFFSLSLFPLLGPTPPQSFFDSDIVDIAIVFVPPLNPRTKKKQGQAFRWRRRQ
ncbi:hypothetical protein BKA57DRAFT_459877 [Linnemannia elongata]|nr:hypothetical protein BKA57DRAFT_459877 [Linnemannia elongata]